MPEYMHPTTLSSKVMSNYWSKSSSLDACSARFAIRMVVLELLQSARKRIEHINFIITKSRGFIMCKMASPAQCLKKVMDVSWFSYKENRIFDVMSTTTRFFFQPIWNESERDRLELYSPTMQRCYRRKAREPDKATRVSDSPLSKASRNSLNKKEMCGGTFVVLTSQSN